MTSYRRICFCLIGLLITPQAVWAEGNAATGRVLANQWCSRCHNIEPNGEMKQQSPSFAAIAVYRSRDYIWTNIMVPHSDMPEIAQILGLNVNDLVAYIVSLEKPVR